MDLAFFLGNTQALAGFIYASPFGIAVLFLFTIFANASLFFPILVEPIVLLIGAFSPNLAYVIFIGIVTGTAAAIGEMSGYILGLLGINTLKKMKEKRVETVFEIGEKLANKGMPIIFLGAFTPFPFDLIGIAAGIIKYDYKRFFIAALAGKTLRYTLVAIVGYVGMEAMPWLAAMLGL